MIGYRDLIGRVSTMMKTGVIRKPVGPSAFAFGLRINPLSLMGYDPWEELMLVVHFLSQGATGPLPIWDHLGSDDHLIRGKEA